MCSTKNRWPGKGTVVKKYMILYIAHQSENVNLEGDFILVDILCIIYWILNLCERINRPSA